MAKNLSIYHSLKELDSFVSELKIESFNEFSFEGTQKKDGEYVIFSFKKDNTEKVYKLIKVMEAIPLPYIYNAFMDRAIFTVLCFALKYKLVEVDIYGQCNIVVISTNKGKYHNDVIISCVVNNEGPVFPPDFNSLNEVFKSIEEVSFNNIKIDVPLVIYRLPSATSYDWPLKSLLNRFNFIKV